MDPISHEGQPTRPAAVPVPLVIAGAFLAAALAVLYAPMWSACWILWWQEESAYSHGILIPLLAALMVWQRRDRLAGVPIRPAASGLAPVLLGLALGLFGRWAHSTMVMWASFLILVVGSIAAVAGWRIAGRLLPPVLYLTFMVPMSTMLTQPVVFGAQMASTQIAATLLRAFGFPVQQMGTVLQLEQYTLEVALPCSGFKTLIALAAFIACYVYLLQASVPKKLLLFGAAMVLGLLVNGLRIALVGVSGELISNETANWVHDNGGLPVTALALGGLFLLSKLMKCGLGTETNDAAARRLAAPGTPNAGAGSSFVVRRSSFVVPALVVAAAAYAVRMPTVQAESLANALPPSPLPLKMGAWEGTDQPVPADVQRALPTAKFLSRRYLCPAGMADVTIIAGSDATALHDPHDCLTGDGWKFLSERAREIQPEGASRPIRMRDIVMTKDGTRARLWYWYGIGPETYDRTLPARLDLFRMRIMKGQTRRAEFVRLIAGGETDSARTEMMLADLARWCATRAQK